MVINVKEYVHYRNTLDDYREYCKKEKTIRNEMSDVKSNIHTTWLKLNRSLCFDECEVYKQLYGMYETLKDLKRRMYFVTNICRGYKHMLKDYCDARGKVGVKHA